MKQYRSLFIGVFIGAAATYASLAIGRNVYHPSYSGSGQLLNALQSQPQSLDREATNSSNRSSQLNRGLQPNSISQPSAALGPGATPSPGNGWIKNRNTVFLQDLSDKVGIGYQFPNVSLSIRSRGDIPAGDGSVVVQGENNTERFEARSFGTTPGPALQGVGAHGTFSSPTATKKGDNLLILGGGGYDSGSPPKRSGNRSIIRMEASEDFTPLTQGSVIKFETTGGGTVRRGERMRITSEGNVGIGTSNPTEKLEVNNGDIFIRVNNETDAQLRLGADNMHQGIIGWNTAGEYMTISTIGNRSPVKIGGSKLYLMPAGNVGINTENPQKKLDVNGSVFVSKEFCFADRCFIKACPFSDDGITFFGFSESGQCPNDKG